MPERKPVRSCPRCGRRRQVNEGRMDAMCRDCYSVEPHWPNVMEDAR